MILWNLEANSFPLDIFDWWLYRNSKTLIVYNKFCDHKVL